MLKINQYILILFSLIVFACKKAGQPELHPLEISVELSYASAEIAQKLPLKDVKVKFTNINTTATLELVPAADGKIDIKALPPGVYNISASIDFSPETYTALTGKPTEKKVSFNASMKNRKINVNNAESIHLKLLSGSIGPWVIKQIYYAGSNTTLGALFRDQFIEFYNNSDSVLYADSLYFSEITGRQSYTNNTYHILGKEGDYQMDWTKAPNMPTNIDPNNDYVYAKALWMIPGTGKQYPVQPGKSIVVAQTALNHKAPFIGTDGKTITVRDPSLTIDLSNADFEAYYAPFVAKPIASDIDNPNVPNIDVISYNGADMVFDSPGRTAFVIFKVDATQNVKQWPQYYYPQIAPPAANADKFYQIPIKYIIDGVEIQPTTASSRVPKKLGAFIDAGFTFVPNSSYSSQSVIRKTEGTENGRIILKDTNNSSEDFDYLPLANPRGFK